jgi:hypothetical protein
LGACDRAQKQKGRGTSDSDDSDAASGAPSPRPRLPGPARPPLRLGPSSYGGHDRRRRSSGVQGFDCIGVGGAAVRCHRPIWPWLLPAAADRCVVSGLRLMPFDRRERLVSLGPSNCGRSQLSTYRASMTFYGTVMELEFTLQPVSRSRKSLAIHTLILTDPKQRNSCLFIGRKDSHINTAGGSFGRNANCRQQPQHTDLRLQGCSRAPTRRSGSGQVGPGPEDAASGVIAAVKMRMRCERTWWWRRGGWLRQAAQPPPKDKVRWPRRGLHRRIAWIHCRADASNRAEALSVWKDFETLLWGLVGICTTQREGWCCTCRPAVDVLLASTKIR